MKKLLLSAAALTILFASCKKDDDNGGGGSSNTFVIGTTSYSAGTVQTVASQLIGAATGTTGASVSFQFNGSALPTTGGSFKVVDGTPAANEVAVSAAVSNPLKGYVSTGNDNVSATVTVSGGKVSVSLPKVWAVNPMTAGDSVQISANITQP